MTQDIQTQDPQACIETEQGLIGRVLMHNDILHEIRFLKAEHFSHEAHRVIYGEVSSRHNSGGSADALTMKTFCEGHEELKAVGGWKYLASLAKASMMVLNPREYAEEIFQMALRRNLMIVCQNAIQATIEGRSAVESAQAISGALEKILGGDFERRAVSDAVVTERILEGIKTRKSPDATGLRRLDKAMDGGLYPGKSYGFAARKKIGKTILASTISYNLSRQGVKHLFVCGEMGAEEIHERVLARHTESFPSSFRNEKREEFAFQEKIADYIRTSDGMIIYQDAPGLTFGELKQYISSAIHKHKIKGVIIDYWQLVGGKGKGQSTAEHLDEVAQWIANYCKKQGIWSIVMAQINQDGNTRGGEGLRLAFDQVYQINRKDISMPETWLEMMDTRYTRWFNVGSEAEPALLINDKGPYFEEVPVPRIVSSRYN